MFRSKTPQPAPSSPTGLTPLKPEQLKRETSLKAGKAIAIPARCTRRDQRDYENDIHKAARLRGREGKSRYALLPHARSPSRSCISLRSLWSARGRTCTSKIAPRLGAQAERPLGSGRGALCKAGPLLIRIHLWAGLGLDVIDHLRIRHGPHKSHAPAKTRGSLQYRHHRGVQDKTAQRVGRA